MRDANPVVDVLQQRLPLLREDATLESAVVPAPVELVVDDAVGLGSSREAPSLRLIGREPPANELVKEGDLPIPLLLQPHQVVVVSILIGVRQVDAVVPCVRVGFTIVVRYDHRDHPFSRDARVWLGPRRRTRLGARIRFFVEAD